MKRNNTYIKAKLQGKAVFRDLFQQTGTSQHQCVGCQGMINLSHNASSCANSIAHQDSRHREVYNLIFHSGRLLGLRRQELRGGDEGRSRRQPRKDVEGEEEINELKSE
ncbi:hypothetical protein LR48_Vigan04g256700 [Vigna angularis]|uniref:Uncharacterized protein n=1 Tax=Phaseolus angularis TaxID=3914 RepID=A0A0L9UII3_PHAAN|nr:hypothetical protein LR48_Vigan04g256700 [Vigna angularis]